MLKFKVSSEEFKKSQELVAKKATLAGRKIQQMQKTFDPNVFQLINLDNDECCLLGNQMIRFAGNFHQKIVAYAEVILTSRVLGLNKLDLTQNEVRAQLMTVLPTELFNNVLTFTVETPSQADINRGVDRNTYPHVKCYVYVNISWADKNRDTTKHKAENLEYLKKAS